MAKGSVTEKAAHCKQDNGKQKQPSEVRRLREVFLKISSKSASSSPSTA
jgi:hypothetical protein